jgi:NADPH2:quinone reductase
MRAIRIHGFGSVEMLVHEEVPPPEASGDEVLIDVALAGVNHTDTRLREIGRQSTVEADGAPRRMSEADLPVIPGGEVVGVDETGRRVVALCGSGGYAQRVRARRDRVFVVPDTLSDAEALALFIHGLTAFYLCRVSARVDRDESIVVHGAAGGIGAIAVQLAKIAGAGRVIATASTKKKRALAVSLGADVATDSLGEGLAERLVQANTGSRVDVVLEAVGGTVFAESLAALGRFGRLVTYGSSSGRPSDVEPGTFLIGSRSLVGFWLLDFFHDTQDVTRSLAELFELAATGRVKPVLGPTYPLAEVAEAHRAIARREVAGKIFLDPRTPGAA